MTVQYKAILVILGILLVLGVAGSFGLLTLQRRDAISQFIRTGDDIVNILQATIENDMLKKDTEHVRRLVSKVGSESDTIESIRIVDSDMRVYAASDSTEVGQIIDYPQLAGVLESGQPVKGAEDNAGGLHIVYPILNKPECQQCHSPETEVLAAIEVDLDKKSLDAQLWQQAWVLLGIGGATLLAIGGALVYSLRRAVFKPLSQLMVDTAREWEEQEKLYFTGRLAALGELVSGIAHELNNPLTSIIGFSRLLLDRDIPDDIREDLKIIDREAQRTAGIVRNLLVFARRQEPQRQEININDAINAVLKLRTYEVAANNIQVRTQLALDLPPVMADDNQLQQVFLNIIINAEHFMAEAHQGGTLTITTERVGATVRASFADDGPGIPPQNLSRVFDPFFTTKEVGKGTGLGLSICHGIVTEHGGRIYAESEAGRGATFIVELPLPPADSDHPGEERLHGNFR